MVLAGAPEIDDRKQDGSQLEEEALLRQAMGGGAGDGRFGITTRSAAPNALATGSPRTDPSFSVPTAGTTPAPADAARPTLGQRIAGDVPKSATQKRGEKYACHFVHIVTSPIGRPAEETRNSKLIQLIALLSWRNQFDLNGNDISRGQQVSLDSILF